jgi:Protein of unknown function, DUF547
MRRDVLPTLAEHAQLKTRARVPGLFIIWGALAFAGGLFAMASGALAAGVETFIAKPYTEGSTATVDHSAWDGLLKTYVVAGKDGLNRVAYAKFKAEGRPALQAFIKSLEAADPSTLNRNEAFAFWANLYNAKTVDIVLNAYPVASIKDINLGGGLLASVTGGPWKAKTLKVKGADLSLDDIEHGFLRPVMKDPRVHYSVNCASIGCPNLGTEAFTGAKLDAQLNAAATAYINSPRGVSIEGSEVTASSIYDWFQKDFGGDEAGVLKHLNSYAGSVLKPKLNGITAIGDFGYDWGLNDAKAAAP